MAEAQFDRLRTQLLELTDRLENHVTDEAQRGTEARLLALSHDFKGTVIVMLEAIAARNQVALLELLNEKVGEDFAKLNEGLTARLFQGQHAKQDSTSDDLQGQHVKRAASVGQQPTPHEPAAPPTKESGLLKSLKSFFKKENSGNASASKPTKIILNENEQKCYYCPTRKRFIFEGEEEEEDKPLPAPPKKEEIKAKEPQLAREKTELESMTAPPVYSRGRKKAAKEKAVQHMLVPLEDLALPVPIDFAEYRRQLTVLFQETGRLVAERNSRAEEQVLQSLYSKLDEQEQLATAVSELTRDSYELLLANCMEPPAPAITILTSAHPIDLSGLSQSKLRAVALQEQLAQLNTLVEQHRMQVSDFESQLAEKVGQLESLHRSISEQRQDFEDRESEKDSVLARCRQELLDKKNSLSALQAQLELLSDQAQEKDRQLKDKDEELADILARLGKSEVQVRTLRGDLENLQTRVEDLEDTLEQRERTIGNMEERLKNGDLVLQRSTTLKQENQAVLQQKWLLEESLRKCYHSALKSRTALLELVESLRSENIFLSRLRRRRSVMQVQSGSTQTNLPQLQSSSKPPAEMSEFINYQIVAATHVIREYQTFASLKINQLSTALEKANSEKSNFEGRVKFVSAQLLKLKLAFDTLKAEHSESAAKIESSKADRSKVEKQAEKLRHDSNFSKGLIEQTNRNLASINKKVTEKEGEIMKLVLETQELEAKLKAVEDDQKQLEKKAIESVEKNVLKDRQLRKAKELSDSLKAELDRQTSQLSQVLQLNKIELEAAKLPAERLSAEKQEVQAKCLRLSQIVQKTTQEAESLKQQVEQYLLQLQTKDREQRQHQDSSKQQIQMLQAAVSALQSQQLSLSAKHNAELSQFQSKFSKTSSQLASVSAELKQKHEQLLAKDQLLLQRVQQESEKFKRQLQESINQTVSEITQIELAKKEEIKTAYKEQLEMVEHKLSESQSKVDELNSTVSELNNINKTLNQQLAKSSQKAIETDQRYKVQIQKLQSEKDICSQLIQELKREYTAVMEAKQLEVDGLKSQKHLIQGKLSQSEEAMLQIDEQLQNKSQEFDRTVAQHQQYRLRLEENLVALNKQIAELNAQMAEMSQQLSRALSQNRSLKESLDEGVTKQSQYAQALHRYEQNSTTKSHLISMLEQDLTSRISEVKELQDIVETLSQEKKQLKWQMEAAQEMANLQAEQRVEELRNCLQDANQRLEKAAAGLQDRNALIEAMNNDLQVKAAETQILKVNIQELHSQIEEAISAKNAFAEQTQRELNTAREREQDLNAIKSQLEAELKQREALIEAMNLDLETQQAAQAQVLDERDRLKEQSDRAQQLLKQLQLTQQQLLDKELLANTLSQSFKSNKEALEAELGTLRLQITDLKLQIETLKASQEKDNEHVKALQDLLSKEKEEQQTELTQLRQELANLRQLSKERDSRLALQNEETERALLEQQNQVNRLQASNSQLSKEVSQLITQNIQLRKQIDQLNTGLRVAEEKHVTTSPPTPHSNQQSLLPKQKPSDFNEELRKAKQQIQQLHRVKASLEKSELDSRNQVEKLKAFVEESSERETALVEKIQRLQAEAAAPKGTEVRRLQDRVKSIELENSELLKQKVFLLKSKGRLEQQLAILSEERAAQEEKPGVLTSALSKLFLTSKQQRKLNLEK